MYSLIESSFEFNFLILYSYSLIYSLIFSKELITFIKDNSFCLIKVTLSISLFLKLPRLTILFIYNSCCIKGKIISFIIDETSSSWLLLFKYFSSKNFKHKFL